MEKYFEKFPTTVYNGYEVKNIMLRTKVLNKVYTNPEFFKSYELTSGIRPDNVAYQLYGDQYMSWLVYLATKTVDPYYDWYMGQYDFEQYVLNKYGDYANAQSRVVYWSNNWYNDNNTIPVSIYNSNATPGYAKKYYEPVFSGKTIVEYKRKQDDWLVNTNEIWEYSVDSDLQVTFDQKVTITNSSSAAVGNGQILFANSSYVRIQHVFGQTDVDVGKINIGSKSANILSSSLMYRNISLQERVYWSPVSYYELEDTNNASKKFLRLLSGEHSMQTALELKRALNP